MKPGKKHQFPYTPARLVDSTIEPYVICYIWDAQKQKKVRKRVSLKGNTPDEKRADAKEVIKLLYVNYLRMVPITEEKLVVC